jgi:hypothetical protein
VQLLMNDAGLRHEAQRLNPHLQLAQLYTAYVSEHNTDDELDPIYQSGVVGPIRSRHLDGTNDGEWLDVVSLWSGRGSLGMPLEFVLASPSVADELRTRRQAGDRAFAFIQYVPPDYGPSSVVSPPTNPYVNFADLPDPEQIQGLIYDTGGHYVAYIRVDGVWWLFNDASVSRVEERTMQQLQACERRGVVIVVYQALMP